VYKENLTQNCDLGIMLCTIPSCHPHFSVNYKKTHKLRLKYGTKHDLYKIAQNFFLEKLDFLRVLKSLLNLKRGLFSMHFFRPGLKKYPHLENILRAAITQSPLSLIAQRVNRQTEQSLSRTYQGQTQARSQGDLGSRE